MLIDLIVGARPNFMKIPSILRAEETTVLDVPCLTLRDTSERPETVTIGTNEPIGTNPPHLAPALARVMAGQWKKGAIPDLWDGQAAERIVAALEKPLCA